MKAEIENPIAYYDWQNFNQSLMEFAKITQDIASARTMVEVRKNLLYSKSIGQINNFEYGFGSSHLWVKQLSRDRDKTMEQVLTVTF